MPSRVIRFPADRALLPTAVYLDANLLISWHLPQHQWHRPARELMAAFSADLLSFRRLRVIDQTRSKALVYQALDNIRDHSLAPHHAFHLALAGAIGVPNIVTNDVQFQKVDADWLSVITFF